MFVAHASSGLRQEGQPSRSVWDGVYTEEQAKRGEALYQQECALCHLATLTGGESAPPLAGADFLSNWNGLTLGDLFERLRISMPPDQPDRLSRQQKIEILAYMLSVNKFPAGSRELPRETYALNQIRLDATKP
ncbi:MAG TPA: cytochrome c [Blastocatellia bacterium]|nr:cytochrome c [Blastocatellia bacterium]